MSLFRLPKFLTGKFGHVTKLYGHADTDVGKVRSNNQDAYYCSCEEGLFIVCDGMGGHRDGELASQTAVEAVKVCAARGESLQKAISEAHRQVFALGEGNHKSNKGRPGSTIVALKIQQGMYQLVWVGDSRGWLLQDKELTQLTVDHTVVQQMVNWGDLSPEEAAQHPDRNRLSQVLGQEEKEPVCGFIEGKVKPGMAFLLATDGMAYWDDRAKLQQILATKSPKGAVELLITNSLRAGGKDNVTCLVAGVT